MWWLFGLINIFVILLIAWVWFRVIKDEHTITKNDKIAIGVLCFLMFLLGFVGTVLIGGLLIYFIIDFIKFIKR
jgi:hypothetical protein